MLNIKLLSSYCRTMRRHPAMSASLYWFFPLIVAAIDAGGVPVSNMIYDLAPSKMSERTAYKHMRLLLNDGWIVTEPCPSDARVKLVKPTEKFCDLYYEMNDKLKNITAKMQISIAGERNDELTT